MNIIKIIVSISVFILLGFWILHGIQTSPSNPLNQIKDEVQTEQENNLIEDIKEETSQNDEKPITQEFDINALADFSWEWVETDLATVGVIPRKPDIFFLTFNSNGTLIGKTDCNNFSGTYVLEGDQIKFGNFLSTMMYCEGSQEQEFISMIKDGTITIEGDRLKLSNGMWVFFTRE